MTQAGSKRRKQYQKINRKRATRKWWHTTRQRLGMIVGVAFVMYASASVAWFGYTGGFTRAANAAMNAVYVASAGMGFKVEYVYVDGREETPLFDVTRAIAVKTGQPIFSVSVEDMKLRLEALPRIRAAQVERVLPNRLQIFVEERVPVAVWQHQGKLQLVDAEGVAIEEKHIERYGQLMTVIGEGAPMHTMELLTYVTQEPELYKEIAAAVRVGERRWNIRFKNGVELKLPEEGAQASWQKFVQMNREQHLMERAIRTVDMRLPDRIYIKPSVIVTPPTESQEPSHET